MEDDLPSSGSAKKGIVSQAWTRVSQIYQSQLDSWTPYGRSRWCGAAALLLLFILRIITKQAMDFDTDENGPELPTRANEEFRPFIRRLPEFKFWYSVTKSTLLAIFLTLFECFNVPVFWPILVMYFFTLMCITMKRQIKHMIKYRYLPFTHSKPKYQGHEDTGKVIGSN